MKAVQGSHKGTYSHKEEKTCLFLHLGRINSGDTKMKMEELEVAHIVAYNTGRKLRKVPRKLSRNQ